MIKKKIHKWVKTTNKDIVRCKSCHYRRIEISKIPRCHSWIKDDYVVSERRKLVYFYFPARGLSLFRDGTISYMRYPYSEHPGCTRRA